MIQALFQDNVQTFIPTPPTHQPENILLSLTDNSDPLNIKVSDFGLATFAGTCNMMENIVGTPLYMGTCGVLRGLRIINVETHWVWLVMVSTSSTGDHTERWV